MNDLNLKGVLPATVLPMTADYEPDFKAFARYLDWLVAENAVAFQSTWTLEKDHS